MDFDITQSIANRMDRLGTEAAFDDLRRAKEHERTTGRPVIFLGLGEPKFPLHPLVIDEVHRSLRAGETGYAPSDGILDLRQAVADSVSVSRGITVDPDEVVIGAGIKSIVSFVITALVNSGDVVIVPDPGYPIYASVINFVGGTCVTFPMREADPTRIDLQAFEGLMNDDRVKLVIINSPHNPTGDSYAADDLEAVAGMVRRHNRAVILSDEAYSAIRYTPDYQSIVSFPHMRARTVVADGVSKTHAWTGGRLGWGVMPRVLARHVARLNTNVFSCVSIPTQRGGIVALRDETGEIGQSVARMVEEFRQRRDVMVAGINGNSRISCRTPEGAFYLWVDIRKTGLSSREFADQLLTDADVAVSAGSSFGTNGEGFIRISYVCSTDDAKKALTRISSFVDRL